VVAIELSCGMVEMIGASGKSFRTLFSYAELFFAYLRVSLLLKRQTMLK
jgi:hypothetical protein